MTQNIYFQIEKRSGEIPKLSKNFTTKLESNVSLFTFFLLDIKFNSGKNFYSA